MFATCGLLGAATFAAPLIVLAVIVLAILILRLGAVTTPASNQQLPSQATLRTSGGDSVVTLAAGAGLSKSKAEVGPGVRCVRLTLVNVALTLGTGTANVAFVGTKLF